MTSCEALALAEERGVTLAARGEQLILKGKAAREIAPLLAPLKPELLAHLRDLAGAKVLPFVLPAPKAGALLAHCTRVRSDTSVTPADVEALAAHFEALGREAAIASERRLWSWWKTEAVPSVGAIEAKVSESNDSVRGWRGVGLVQRYTSGQQFPDNRLEESSRETNRESVSRSVPGVPCLTDAPDALAQIGHCLRVRPGTTASDADKQALVEYFAGLNGTANAVAGRLFDYWRANAAPTVADFLAIETKGRAHA